MILATVRRGRFTGQTSQTILRLCPSSVWSWISRLAQGSDLSLRLGRAFLASRLNSVSVESTASCSREARLPLRHCRQLQRSSPILSWFGRQQRAPESCRCHRPTVIQEPCHACQSPHVAWSIAGEFAFCGSPRSIQLHCMHHAVPVESLSDKTRCRGTPVGVSRRPLRSSSRLHWCLVLQARPAPGH